MLGDWPGLGSDMENNGEHEVRHDWRKDLGHMELAIPRSLLRGSLLGEKFQRRRISQSNARW